MIGETISRKMEPWLFLFILLPLALILKSYKSKRIHRRPPGPPGLPFIGNLHQYDSQKPHEFLKKLSQKYGPLISLRFGRIPVLVISSAKTAKEALKTHDAQFSGRMALLASRKLSYNRLDVGFAPYGEYWREMRKISVLHLLSPKRIQSFLPIIEDEVSLFIAKISRLSSSSQLINLNTMSVYLATTIVCRIAFGKNFDEESLDQKKLDEILRESQAMFSGFFVADYLPLLGWIDKLTGMSDRLENNFRDLDLFYQELIEDHLNPNRPDTMKDDVVDILIKIKDEKPSLLNLTWDHIKAMLMIIFIAGSDTSASSIIWAMTALMKSPSVMKRAQTEIREVVGKNGTIGEEQLQKLPYLDAVIKETFRLYPPTPILVPRETIEDCTIQGYDVEAKTMVIVNAWAISRDPESWENPEDFAPERFLDSNIDMKGNDFELIPFGTGRRGCPGINLGLSNVKVALANLLHSFDWELPPGMKTEDIDTDASPGITMCKKIPLCLVAKKYNLS